MGEPATCAPGPANPTEERRCRKCDKTKPVSPETWPYRSPRRGQPYQAHGQVCKECEKKRKTEYEAKRDKIAASVASVVTSVSKETPDDKRKALTAANKLDVASALKAGSKVLNDFAPSVLARVLEYAEDPDHEHHLWALELLAQRILPRKLYEELGGQAAGTGGIADKRPMFQINVLPAQPHEQTPAPQFRDITAQVEVLEVNDVKERE